MIKAPFPTCPDSLRHTGAATRLCRPAEDGSASLPRAPVCCLCFQPTCRILTAVCLPGRPPTTPGRRLFFRTRVEPCFWPGDRSRPLRFVRPAASNCWLFAPLLPACLLQFLFRSSGSSGSRILFRRALIRSGTPAPQQGSAGPPTSRSRLVPRIFLVPLCAACVSSPPAGFSEQCVFRAGLSLLPAEGFFRTCAEPCLYGTAT